MMWDTGTRHDISLSPRAFYRLRLRLKRYCRIQHSRSAQAFRTLRLCSLQLLLHLTAGDKEAGGGGRGGLSEPRCGGGVGEAVLRSMTEVKGDIMEA